MARETISLAGPLLDYFAAHAFREDALLARLRAETDRMPERGMLLSPEQGALLSLLTRISGTRRAIEVGTFTGYSALVTARALPRDGRLIACDVSEEFTAVARRHWAEAGVAGRIDLRLAPALATLEGLLLADAANSFDQVLLDADKANYPAYYACAKRLVRPGGLILVDNTLWSGRVADPSDTSADTVAIRRLNALVAADAEVEHCLVPIGDGFTLIRRREG